MGNSERDADLAAAISLSDQRRDDLIADLRAERDRLRAERDRFMEVRASRSYRFARVVVRGTNLMLGRGRGR